MLLDVLAKNWVVPDPISPHCFEPEMSICNFHAVLGHFAQIVPPPVDPIWETLLVYIFFLTCFPAESHWTEIIQVVVCQYGGASKCNGLEIQLLQQGKLIMYSSNYVIKLF